MTDLAHPIARAFAFDAFDRGWWVSTPAPCVVCDLPATCRDSQGRPRHRVNCLAPSTSTPKRPGEVTVDRAYLDLVDSSDPNSDDPAERIRAQVAERRHRHVEFD